jgi:hypothetical protein
MNHSQCLDVNSEKRRDLVLRSNSEVFLHNFPFVHFFKEHYNCHRHAIQADLEASDFV